MLSGNSASIAKSGFVPEAEEREREGHGQLPTLLQRPVTGRKTWPTFFRRDSSVSTTASIISEADEEGSCNGDICADDSLQTAGSPIRSATVQNCSSHTYSCPLDCFSGIVEMLKKLFFMHPDEQGSGEHTSPTSNPSTDHTALSAYSSRPTEPNLVMWEDDEGNWQFADLTSPRRRSRTHRD